MSLLSWVIRAVMVQFNSRDPSSVWRCVMSFTSRQIHIQGTYPFKSWNRRPNGYQRWAQNVVWVEGKFCSCLKPNPGRALHRFRTDWDIPGFLNCTWHRVEIFNILRVKYVSKCPQNPKRLLSWTSIETVMILGESGAVQAAPSVVSAASLFRSSACTNQYCRSCWTEYK